MLPANDLRNGHVIELEGSTVVVLNYHHQKTGRGGAVIKVKIKDIKTGAITEYTCRPGDKFKEANVDKKKALYQYDDGDSYYFMENDTFDQVAIPADQMEEEAKYLVENTEVFIEFLDGNPIAVELPKSVVLEVADTTPGIRNATATSSLKPATLVTGAKVNVPEFINSGEKIKVDTRTGEYLERA